MEDVAIGVCLRSGETRCASEHRHRWCIDLECPCARGRGSHGRRWQAYCEATVRADDGLPTQPGDRDLIQAGDVVLMAAQLRHDERRGDDSRES